MTFTVKSFLARSLAGEQTLTKLAESCATLQPSSSLTLPFAKF